MYQTARSFLDIEVYKKTYKAAIVVGLQIVPKLPESEKFGLKDQSARASKSIPALIAEGYARKNHQKDWQKYLNEAVGECNEMIVHLSFIKDLHPHLIEIKLCEDLIDTYNIAGKQLFCLGRSWQDTSKPNITPPTPPPPIITPTTRPTTHNS